MKPKASKAKREATDVATAAQYPSPSDIAEMKAKGYDSSTIAEAVRQWKRESVPQFCRVIETAFAGVTLGGGIGLQEAQGIDDYAGESTRASYRVKDEQRDWRRIPADALNRCNSSLHFFDAEGMRFHLPAYLVADLQGAYGHDLLFCLTHLDAPGKSRFALLSASQRAAVRAFLLHFADDPRYDIERPKILRAVKEYWNE